MKEKLTHNLGLKILSVVLAALLWLMVVQIGDPQDVDYFDVPVNLVNTELLEKQNKVFEVLDDSDDVRVTIRAPRSVLRQLRASDIVAEADVSKLTDINTVAITYRITNVSEDSIKSVSGDREVVRLNVENRSSKYVNLLCETSGEVAEGYIVAGVSTDQNRIEVSGPESVVDQVKNARVTMGVTDATGNLTANLEIKLYDTDGNLVENSNLKKNVNYVRTTVEVLATKEVPIAVSYMGVPAEGYLATGEVSCDPDTVLIAGSKTDLSSVSQIGIPEDAINITGESSDMISMINLKDYLPENIRFADSTFSGRVTATVHIEPLAERTLIIPLENIQIVNLPDGMEAVWAFGVTECEVKVSGLGARLDELRPESITGVIDVQAWMKAAGRESLRLGTYTVPVTFSFEEGIMVVQQSTLNIAVQNAE